MNDTPTPRTDEITKHLDEALNLDSAVDFVVYADKLQELSRQLERELAEATRRLNEFEHPRDPIDQPKPLDPLTV